jgi:hypothetical protein
VVYPDLGFILSLLIPGDRSTEASTILRDLPHPLSLSLIHRVQIENGLLRALHSSGPGKAAIGRNAIILWRQYILEEVFAMKEFDLEASFIRSAELNAQYEIQPPRWGLLLHVGVALEAEATFLSFDPALRKCARTNGLKVLPERF